MYSEGHFIQDRYFKVVVLQRWPIYTVAVLKGFYCVYVVERLYETAH